MTLDIFLLTSLLILKIKQQNENAAGLTKLKKKILFSGFQQTSKYVLKIILFNAIQVTTNNIMQFIVYFNALATRHSPSLTP